MRTKILFFLILLTANVFAQKIDEEQVPKDVLIGLETIYPEVKAKSWELKDGSYFASIKVDGQSYIIRMYGKLDGKANSENKYE